MRGGRGEPGDVRGHALTDVGDGSLGGAGRTTSGLLALLDAGVGVAAFGAALELGLFWRIENAPLATGEVAAALGIPAGRCGRWLELLEGLGFLEHGKAGWSPTALTRTAILEAYSQPTWALLAEETRERLAQVTDLPATLRHGLGADRAPSYVDRMAADPDRARRFCRMLFELHQPLAATIAATLDLTGVRQGLDLGGGSGVLSIALARRNPELRLTIVDVATVCDAAREIVADAARADLAAAPAVLPGPSIAERVDFLPADILADELPGGQDLVIECDVGLYDEALFRRARGALAPGGRFVIVDELGPSPSFDLARSSWAFVRSLRDPDAASPTSEGVAALLVAAGFEVVDLRALPAVMPGIGGLDSSQYVLIVARPC